MTLPVFRAPELVARTADGTPAPSAGTALALGAEVASHAVKVRRMAVGEDLDVTDGAGLRVRGTLTAAAPDSLVLTVTAVTQEPVATPSLVLLQALAKQDRDLQAIEAATEVGVDAVIPWAAQRSIADWPAKKAGKMAAKWENTLRAAALQARRVHVPALHALVRGDRAAKGLGPGDLVLVLHEEASVPVPTALADVPEGTERIVLVVGPEGGITEAEVAAFTAAGARIVRLGPTVLRASSAGPVGLALVQTLLGRWA